MAILDKHKNPQIQSLLLKDIDKNIIEWFKTKYPLIIEGRSTPVLFVSAERWSQIFKEKYIKDERGQIILPVISVRRLNPEHKKERSVPQMDETDLTFYRRIATQGNNSETGINLNDYQQGTPDPKYFFAKDNPVFELLKIPFPNFITIDYEVIIWLSQINHQNIELENIFDKFNGGRNFFIIDGYTFMVLLKSTEDQSNIEDFTGKERIIKTKFKMEIHGFLLDRSKVKISRTLTNIRFSLKES